MKKNVAGQVVGAQVCSAADGSDFSGSVTVYVTGDGGTQATGSVGAGACTNEGNGFYTYAPAQAETNFDHVAFTFKGTGAITSTVQVYTSFPQTGDAFGRLGAPAGASVSADIAGVQSDTNDIQTRIPAALVSGRMDASVGAMAANTMTASALASDAVTEIQSGLATAAALATLDDYVDTEVAAIKAKTDLIPASPAAVSDIPTAAAVADQVWDEVLSGHLTGGSTGAALNASGSSGDPWATALPGAYTAGSAGYIVGTNLDAAVSSVSGGSGLDAAGVRAAIGLASANLDTQLGAIDTVVDAVLVDTAEIGTAGAGLTALASAANLATLAGYVDTEVAAIKAKTDNLPASPAAVGDIPTATENADALLNRDMSAVSDTNARSPLNALRFIRNKWSISGSTLTVTKENDTTAAWTAAVSTTPGADPVTGNDPA